MQNFNWSISNILIIVSIILFGLSSIFPEIYNLGMSSYFLQNQNYTTFFLQFFIFQLLHGSFFHLLSNAIFIGYFGNQVELIIGEKKFIVFFFISNLFIGTSILILSAGNTIGMSGFALAVLTYYTLHLQSIKNPEYTGGVTAIIINLMIGFVPGISFLGHFFGMIFGIVYFYILKTIKKRS